MRIRNITGNTYYTRSGAKIVGKVREKFMLIDGIRVTTGSYRQVAISFFFFFLTSVFFKWTRIVTFQNCFPY